MSFPEDKPNDPQAAAEDARKQSMMIKLLDPQARTRLHNIRMVKPDLAANVENYLLELATQGRIGQVSDEQLKQMLLSLQQPKRDFKFSESNFYCSHFLPAASRSALNKNCCENPAYLPKCFKILSRITRYAFGVSDVPASNLPG